VGNPEERIVKILVRLIFSIGKSDGGRKVSFQNYGKFCRIRLTNIIFKGFEGSIIWMRRSSGKRLMRIQ
jgi:hypothetical protein